MRQYNKINKKILKLLIKINFNQDKRIKISNQIIKLLKKVETNQKLLKNIKGSNEN